MTQSEANKALDNIVYAASLAGARVDPKDKELISAALTRLSELEPIILELVEALNRVLDTVGGCHDCWSLSASDEEQASVTTLLTLAANRIAKIGEV